MRIATSQTSHVDRTSESMIRQMQVQVDIVLSTNASSAWMHTISNSASGLGITTLASRVQAAYLLVLI
jgi:hypothetical protein